MPCRVRPTACARRWGFPRRGTARRPRPEVPSPAGLPRGRRRRLSVATLPEAGATKRKETLGWPGPTAAAPARAPRRRAARRVARARTPQRGAMSTLGAQNGVRVAAAQGRAQGAAGARRVCRVRQPAAGARARCGTPHVCAQAHARPAGRASGPSTTVLPSAARSATAALLRRTTPAVAQPSAARTLLCPRA